MLKKLFVHWKTGLKWHLKSAAQQPELFKIIFSNSPLKMHTFFRSKRTAGKSFTYVFVRKINQEIHKLKDLRVVQSHISLQFLGFHTNMVNQTLRCILIYIKIQKLIKNPPVRHTGFFIKIQDSINLFRIGLTYKYL